MQRRVGWPRAGAESCICARNWYASEAFKVRLLGGKELSDVEYKRLLQVEPRNAAKVRYMVRDATVYVRGRIRHDDHATIVLHGWCRVYLNGEFTTGRVAFYD